MIGEDVGSVSLNVAGQAAEKALEVAKELLSVLIHEASDRESVVRKGISAINKSILQSKLNHGGLTAYKDINRYDTKMEELAKTDISDLNKICRANKIPFAVMADSSTVDSKTINIVFRAEDSEKMAQSLSQLLKSKLEKNNGEYSLGQLDISPDNIEAFRERLKELDIEANFIQTPDEKINCVYVTKQKEAIIAVEKDFNSMINDINNNVKIDIVTPESKSKTYLTVSDKSIEKKFKIHFTTQDRVVRELQDKMGYSKAQSIVISNEYKKRLSPTAQRAYERSAAMKDEMRLFEKNILFEKEHPLLKGYTFVSIARTNYHDGLPGKVLEAQQIHIINNETKAFTVIQMPLRREQVQNNLEMNLGVMEKESPELYRALCSKIEKIGFVPSTEKISLVKTPYEINRDSLNSCVITAKGISRSINLSNRQEALKDIQDTFHINESKANKILDKAITQSPIYNRIADAKERSKKTIKGMTEALEKSIEKTKFTFKK